MCLHTQLNPLNSHVATNNDINEFTPILHRVNLALNNVEEEIQIKLIKVVLNIVSERKRSEQCASTK